jgi:hypothetical protein
MALNFSLSIFGNVRGETKQFKIAGFIYLILSLIVFVGYFMVHIYL